MKFGRSTGFLLGVVGLSGAGLGCSAAANDADITGGSDALANNVSFANDFGRADYFSTTGFVDADKNTNPFFQDLGANHRTCNSCHKLENGMGISTATINALFNATNGFDPIFTINDGSNAPSGPWARTTTVGDRRNTFSMLLTNGVIRVGIGLPATRDYELVFVRDPYAFASAAELSLFRRPLPSVNVKANVLAMWDGRESEGRPAIRDALINQANDATQGHAQRATPLDLATRQKIADFQLNLFNAQTTSTLAGDLKVAACAECETARGGAQNVRDAVLGIPGSPGIGSPGGSEGALAPFSEGVNDPFKFGGVVCAEETEPPLGPTAPCFKNVSMTFFDPFESDAIPADGTTLTKNRTDLGDGENIFYTKKMFFTTAGGGTEVPGLSDVTINGVRLTEGTCTTCHNTPEVGSHSAKRFFNTGTSDPFVGGPNNRDHNPLATNLGAYPYYSIGPKSNPNAYTTITDPGLALRTGKIADLGKFKVPNLRGLGSRAPYFHNGVAKTLNDVVNFYNVKFGMHMTSEEIRKVIVFLSET